MEKGEIYYFKIKIIPFIIIFRRVIDMFKSQNGASVQWDISDLPFVQNKDYQY